MGWTFGFCDLDGNNIGGIRNAYERKLHLQLNGLDTASVRLSLADPLVDKVLVTNSGDVLLKVYQDSTLRFIGDLTSAEEVSRGEEQKPPSVVFNFAGPMWRLQKRLIGTTQTYTDVNGDDIFEQLLLYANNQWDTGIRWGTPDTLYPASAGPWTWKPIAEAFTEIQTVGIPFPITVPPASSLVAEDSFASPGGGAPLDGQTDLKGNTWTFAGDAGDFTEQSSYVSRNVSTTTTGRFAYTNLTVLNFSLVGAEVRLPAGAGTGYGLSSGVFSRLKNVLGAADSYLHAYLEVSTNTFYVRQVISGVSTTLASADFDGGVSPSNWHVFRLLADDIGNWQAWLWRLADGVGSATVLSGRSPDLVAGFALSSQNGCVRSGIWDSGTVVDGRDYRAFFVANAGYAQDVDFRFNPVEPASDPQGYPGTVPKTWTLDVKTQVGTSKPEVVLEYGSGQRSLKGYTRKFDREGLANEAFALPEEDVKYALDGTSANARGLFMEMVTSDLVDSRLRQALVDLHVAVRATARQLVTFEPTGTIGPQYGTDFVVGDYVTGRAVVDGSVRFNGLFRVDAADISVNDEGQAEITPDLVL